jgi:hypothetical protein
MFDSSFVSIQMSYIIRCLACILLVHAHSAIVAKNLLFHFQRTQLDKHNSEIEISNQRQLSSTQPALDNVNQLPSLGQLGNYTRDVINELKPMVAFGKETMGNVIFNVHHFTQFVFDGNQVYIYSPKKNDENIHQPRKWTFFYVPVLQPIQKSLLSPWVSVNVLEVRTQVAMGTQEVELAARKAIANQFDSDLADKYSKLWVVAPLMLDSISAYIVTVGSTPVPGVMPFHIDNPNTNSITFRFACLNKEAATTIAVGLLTGNLDIEVSLYFSGMHRVKTNMITITATHLQSITSKTIADGGGSNSTFIHREQASSFVAKYINNVRKLIYIEEPNINISLLTNGLEEQLTALFYEGEYSKIDLGL